METVTNIIINPTGILNRFSYDRFRSNCGFVGVKKGDEDADDGDLDGNGGDDRDDAGEESRPQGGEGIAVVRMHILLSLFRLFSFVSFVFNCTQYWI
eukprot:CAMPEP_0195293456 /NCGR_PEP_ID=MMETSP0707-20130614/12489_1 /TAXON_ID=33640 /ORGANISM="Asterionellopsis glacialis, Strain CCMP134" /LENGTH=96 /DNA_ID=CAMNT_0040354175 /DNA_START=77 /DNA_END=364 /DNA_ORIENTATION=-